ncbi:MAG: hypothetical protein KHY90_06090 [Clostridium sp.]|nr:hypothetical protein [Clostridium sp.]
MKLRKVVVLFLVASMVLSLTSCTRQTASPQVEHTSKENDTVQENIMEENNVGEDQIPEESSQKGASSDESSTEKNFPVESEQETKEQSFATEKFDQTDSNYIQKEKEEDKLSDKEQTDTTKEESEGKQQDLSAYNSFVNPLKYAFILDKSFSSENPFLQACAPEIIYNWCHIVLSISGEPDIIQDSNGIDYYKAEDVEKIIEKYYGMSKEELRTSPSYSSAVNGYQIPQGNGGFLPYFVITDVEEDGDTIILRYDVYDSEEKVSSTQLLTIQKTGFDSWKYIENKEL